MTKKRLKQLFLVPLLAVIFYACYLDVLEVEVSETTGFSIAEARSWFEANVPSKPDGVSLRSGGESDDPEDGSSLPWRIGDESSRFTPDWENAVVGTDARFRIIEVPLQSCGWFAQMSSELAERAAETGDERYLATIMRLLVRICHATGTKDGFVMIASPDLEYLNRRSDNPMQDFTYLNRSEDFSGLVFYYNLAGELVTGYKTTDGKFFRFVPQTQADDDEILLRVGEGFCYEVCYKVTFRTRVYSNTTIGGETTTEFSRYKITTEINCFITSCHGGGGGGIDGGGNSGGGNDNGVRPTEPEQIRTDRIFRKHDIVGECWETLERFFNEVMGNCVGRALVDALAGRLGTDRIYFARTHGRSRFEFGAEQRRIFLNVNDRFDVLFHEMFHAFQSFREDREVWNHPQNNPQLNIEMEARFAHYMFTRQMRGAVWRSQEYAWRNDPSFRTVMELTRFLDHNGNLHRTSRAFERSFNLHITHTIVPYLRAADGNAPKRFDYSRVGIDNFRNLQSLIINCE